MNDKRLTCTRCPDGGHVSVTLRDRNPNGWQPYAQCLKCGARNWEHQAGEPWASIRYQMVPVPSDAAVVVVQP